MRAFILSPRVCAQEDYSFRDECATANCLGKVLEFSKVCCVWVQNSTTAQLITSRISVIGKQPVLSSKTLSEGPQRMA